MDTGQNISHPEEVLYFENFDLENVITPVDVDKYEKLLKLYNYNSRKTNKLVNGFKYGFSIGYEGNHNVRITAPNLQLHVGNPTVLWNKVMKEVKCKRYAGPFSEIPFKNYIQSPIGLVPKDGGKNTRLIFHLSYPRNKPGISVNANTPKEICKVSYPDFAKAVKLCKKAGISCSIAKSDMTAAFRNLGILKKHWKFLIMKATNPLDGKTYFFVDKCLPFGSSISCKHFQDFSDSIAYILEARNNTDLVNYLDDYLFVELLRRQCNEMVQQFLDLCQEIRFPVSLEKTFWATTQLVFLGMLLDTVKQMVSIPIEKIERARFLINRVLEKKSKKITLQEQQKICGFLNFLCQAIVPGRTFTRRLYPKLTHKLKPHHHIRISSEMRMDLEVWAQFLKEPEAFARPFIDYEVALVADEINLYTDASTTIGYGGYCNKSWMCGVWSESFKLLNPNIQFLELFAVTAALLNWLKRFCNRRIILFCDNDPVCRMINKSSTGDKQCMKLLRLITFECMKCNSRVFAKWVGTLDNERADMLSRQQIDDFIKKYGDEFETEPTDIDERLWPVEKIWHANA